MDETSNESSTRSDEEPKAVNEKLHVDSGKARWRALFFFTTRSHLPVLGIGVAASGLAGVVTPATAFAVGNIFDGYTTYSTGASSTEAFFDHEKKYVLILLAISGGAWLVESIQFAAWLAFGECQAKNARDQLFYGLLKKDIEWYDMRRHGIGAMLPRIQAQIRELQLAASQPLGLFINAIATAILCLVQALVRSWELTLVTIAPVPLIMCGVIWAGNGMQQHLERQQEKLAEAQKVTTNAFAAIETVKCFNGQEIEREKYMMKIREAASSYGRVARSSGLQWAFVVLLTVSMFVTGFYYGGVLIAKRDATPADVITTFLSAVGAFQAVNGILPQILVLEKGRHAGNTLRAVVAELRQCQRSVSNSAMIEPAGCRGDIRVSGLTFAYPSRPGQPALMDVTMRFPAGKMSFLIGNSGSGKSTIGQLLLRFYEPVRGQIELDGRPLWTLHANWLRKNVTLVEQSSVLFDDTLMRNIAFGRAGDQNVTKEEVTAAAEFALLQMIINDLPNGLETQAGQDGGSNLSGGQRQRLALARARIRDTPVLILDESTSALDHISRTLMMDAVREWRRGRTTIIITHDITQIAPNDYVLVLQNGRLVQDGYRKYLERSRDSPFQSFLQEQDRRSTTNFLAKDATKQSPHVQEIRSATSMQSLSMRPNAERTSDDLEVYLDVSESKRASLVSRVIKDPSSVPTSCLPGPLGGMTYSWSVPWNDRADLLPYGRAGGLEVKELTDIAPRTEEKTVVATNEAQSSMDGSMESLRALIERTGQHAAERRAAVGSLYHRQRNPISSHEKHILITDCDKKRQELQDVEQHKFSSIFASVWPSLERETRFILLIGCWGSSIHAVISPIFSYVLSRLLHTYSIPGGDMHLQLVYSMAMLALAFTDALHTFFFRFCLEYSGQQWIDNLRSRAMARVLDQPRIFFDLPVNTVTRLAGNLDRDAEETRNLLGRFAAMVWQAGLMCSLALAWSLATQWEMTLVAISTSPYLLGSTRLFALISGRWENLANAAADSTAAVFSQTFTNIKTVRALTLEDHFVEMYQQAARRSLLVGLRRSFYTGVFYGLSDSAGQVCLTIVFYVGAVLVKQGASPAQVLQVFTMLYFMISNLSAILEYIPQIAASKDTASRLLRLTCLPRDSHEHLGIARLHSVGTVMFDDFHFSYPLRTDQAVLQHLNLRLEPGTTMAIVGASGCGKSTVASLLLKMYSTTTNARKGRLTIAGREIQHVDTVVLRSLIACVPQTPKLFPATVLENITYGLPSDSRYNSLSAAITAAQQARIHEYISSLPGGYSAILGEGGLGLSGGQIQRIAIARALVRQPAVLILDEATSALDVESAALIRQTVAGLMKTRSNAMSVLIITHSRGMMEIADQVVVLDQGRVLEQGGFKELLNIHGALHNLLNGGVWSEPVK